MNTMIHYDYRLGEKTWEASCGASFRIGEISVMPNEVTCERCISLEKFKKDLITFELGEFKGNLEAWFNYRRSSEEEK